MDVRAIYTRRFEADLPFRRAMWKVLCRDFFQRYVRPDSRVLEIGAGYCEFINNIRAANKTAVDLNPDIGKYAEAGVEIVRTSSTDMGPVGSSSVDVVFASNFFEHLARAEILDTFREVRRILAPGGLFMVLQPNIRFCGGDYWMFFDHVTPIDDRAFVEALEISGFETVEVIERFLPYTTKSRLPRAILLIQLYLRLPLLWRWFGQQSFLLSRKPN